MVANERLCAMKPHLGIKRVPLSAGLEPGTARLVGQRILLSYWGSLWGTGIGGQPTNTENSNLAFTFVITNETLLMGLMKETACSIFYI